MSKEKLVYVKDNEGYVTKKPESQVSVDESIITKEEWEKGSGIEYYKKTFGRGGYRPNAGRKKEYSQKVKETYEMEEDIAKALKDYAKKNKISKNKAITMAIKKLSEA